MIASLWAENDLESPSCLVVQSTGMNIDDCQIRAECSQMNSLPDFFGITYLINLPERTDRLKSAGKQLTRVGWNIGATGVHIFPALRYAEPAGFPSAPIRGCFHSHLECLRSANAEGRQSVLILEDDIALSTSLPRLASSIKLQLAIQKWDFVYFGHYETGKIPLAHRNTNASELRFDEWTNDILTAHFYGVNGRIMPRLIAHLSKLSQGRMGDQVAGPMPVDGAYNVFRRNNRDIRCLIAHPRLGWQMPSRSDITPHALDRLAFLRPVNSFLRKFKQIGSLWHS
jgi:glycosyl transferase, family 25